MMSSSATAAVAAATTKTTMKPLTIVITGASKGLGLGMAKSYLKMGHRLGLCARSTSPPEDLVQEAASDADSGNKERRLYYESVDVSNELSVQKFLDNVVNEFATPKIDVWINNAGILGPIGPIRNLSSIEFERTIQINLMSVFYGTKAYINHIRNFSTKTTTPNNSINNDDANNAEDQNRRDFTLINISSGAAIKGYAGWGAYCASKASVDRLTECAFLEEQDNRDQQQLDRWYLRAYSIAPGIVDTDMQATIRDTPKAQFPMVDKFLNIKANDAFNTPTYIANQLMNDYVLPEGPQTLPVVQRLPSEKQNNSNK